ncbi:MAG: arginine repressor [Bacteroidetes bacterium]|nr:arginine repressor [Bacteroidota bacterium]
MTKTARQFAIKEILTSRSIASQEELRRELGKRGFRVTQATLSRDMKELGASWIVHGGVAQYAINADAGGSALRPIVGAEVLGIDANECMVVIRTLAGAAHTVGEFVDVQNNPDILGTVAGDNTLLVIPASTSKTRLVLNYLKHIFIEEAA